LSCLVNMVKISVILLPSASAMRRSSSSEYSPDEIEASSESSGYSSSLGLIWGGSSCG
jgi:hypothetical protein